MNKDKLMELKSSIDAAKTNVSKLKGRQEQQMLELAEQWGCKTVKEAEAKLKTYQKDIDELDKAIADSINQLKEKYDIEDY